MSETMSEEEKLKRMKDAEDMFNSMYPVGKERWIKVKYLDREKAMKNISLSSWNNGKEEELGFEVTAICTFDDYNSQVSAMVELRGELQGVLSGYAHQNVSPSDMAGILDNMLINKIHQLKQNTIVYAEDQKEVMFSDQLVLDKNDNDNWIVKMGDSILESYGHSDEDKMDALEFIYNRSTNEIK